MILGITQLVRLERPRLEPLIGVAGKSEDRRAGGLRRGLGGEGLESVAVEPGQIVAEAHQPLEVAQGQVARGLGQPQRLLLHRRRGRLDIDL